MVLSFEQALAVVREKVSATRPQPKTESLPLHRVPGRVIGEDVIADRDYPPFNRSTRDGYAVRSADLGRVPSVLENRGEVRAGEYFSREIVVGDCLRIMTGAPVPTGADAVVMFEHTHAQDDRRVEVLRAVQPWENVVRQGSEAPAGNVVIRRGRRLGAGEIGLLASVGKGQVRVAAQPRVAILPTGDEVVPIDGSPEWFQIRNSNAVTLATQVAAAGGIPVELQIAPDEKEALRRLIDQGLESDLLLLSGGVSMGTYDFVREVFTELGAEFYFQGVAIRPGKPLVFGRVRDKFLFGLPGNPVSTYVTFELFVRPALWLLQGAEFECPVFLRARLGKRFRQKSGLTAFMPARVEPHGADPVVNLVGWQGSGDLVGVTDANCFLVIHPEQTDLPEGEWVDVMPKPA
jgi:molybdopterin molybdotransferase